MARKKAEVAPVVAPEPEPEVTAPAVEASAEEAPKKKRGWPKGKPRKPQVSASA